MGVKRFILSMIPGVKQEWIPYVAPGQVSLTTEQLNTIALQVSATPGPTGPIGPQGTKGDTGAKGETGLQGPKGDTGLQGQKGDIGDRGLQGLPGNDGPQGLKGDKGDTGSQGLKGDQGIQGIQGNPGTNGTNGTNGSDASVTKTNVESVLTGPITTHTHDASYTLKRLYANLTAPVASSGTTEKVLLQLAIPANRAVVGSTFRAWVVGNSSSTGTLIFRIKCGANGSTSDTEDWKSVTSAAQAANARAGFECLITIRSSTTIAVDGVGYAGAVQLPTTIAAPTTPAIAINGIWYINMTVVCSSGTFTAQVGSIEEIR
jgi:hypothetical protein